ncbi:hypothetical protein NB716_000259 [Pantoea ananatis]|nr:hypothetical protein [Pantoea ananatis]
MKNIKISYDFHWRFFMLHVEKRFNLVEAN